MGGEYGGSLLERVALRLTVWTERWIPDSYIFAIVLTIVALALGVVVAGESPHRMVLAWGQGFWVLLTFSMQMVLILVTGYVLAATPPIRRFIMWLSTIPKTPKGSAALLAAFSLITAYINWGFSLIFSALLAREIAKRVRDADYRALAATAYVGLGSIWHQGLSASAPLLMATPGSMPRELEQAYGIIPVTRTLFLPQTIVTVIIVSAAVVATAYLYMPRRSTYQPPQEVLADPGAVAVEKPVAMAPAERLMHSPILSIIIGLMGLYWLVNYFATAGGLAAINLNVVNFTFLMLGILLHWTPARLVASVREAARASYGIILQFPFYAGIFGMIQYTNLGRVLTEFFVRISAPATYPLIVFLYSALLNMFVPSGGSKWLIEAPYILGAGKQLNVNLGYVVVSYGWGDSWTNLVQPFWALPLLGLTRVEFRDIMGYTTTMFIVEGIVLSILIPVMGLSLL